jgi:hypothetical protein
MDIANTQKEEMIQRQLDDGETSQYHSAPYEATRPPITAHQCYPYIDSYERVNAAYESRQPLSVITQPMDQSQWSSSGYDADSPVSPIESYSIVPETTPALHSYGQPYMPGENLRVQWQSGYVSPHRSHVPVQPHTYTTIESDMTTPATYLLHLSANPRSNLSASSSQIALQAYTAIPAGDKLLPMPPPLRPRGSLPTRLNDISDRASAMSLNSPTASCYSSFSYGNSYDYPPRVPPSPLIHPIGLASNYAESEGTANSVDHPSSASLYSENMNRIPRVFTEYPHTYAELSAVRESYRGPLPYSHRSSRYTAHPNDRRSFDSPPASHSGKSFSSNGTVSSKSSSDTLYSQESTSTEDKSQTSPALTVSQPMSTGRSGCYSVGSNMRDYYVINGKNYDPVFHESTVKAMSSIRSLPVVNNKQEDDDDCTTNPDPGNRAASPNHDRNAS